MKMCKLNPKNKGRRIDPCMKPLLQFLSGRLINGYEILSCCCGHGKYRMSLIIKNENLEYPIEVFSNKIIRRTKRFYKRDKEGYYFIPELQY